MDLLDKLRAVQARCDRLADGSATPGLTVIDRVVGPCEVVVQGRPTLMFGSNNYLGLTSHPDVIEAGCRALSEYGAGTTGSRTANGTLAIHEELEQQFADWYGKRQAIIFSTGYQANLSLIGGLCGAGDVILIDSDSHASIYDATRQTASQVIGFRHNSPESLQKKLERLPRGAHGGRNRLVVVEGLYSIRGDVAPLREIAAVCRSHEAYLLVDEAHSLGTYG
ncbi:MAG: aminotransferase class I/II-fold pyridoxal phosphate-dependent enzyme, partial [Vicinamibacterales bacterium]